MLMVAREAAVAAFNQGCIALYHIKRVMSTILHNNLYFFALAFVASALEDAEPSGETFFATM